MNTECVKQVDTISPKLFTAVLYHVLRTLEKEDAEIQINREYRDSLPFFILL